MQTEIKVHKLTSGYYLMIDYSRKEPTWIKISKAQAIEIISKLDLKIIETETL